jgi:hypothetical protein
MEIESRFTFIRNEQPRPSAWKQLQQFAATWNRQHVHRFTDRMGFVLDIKFKDDRDPEYAEFMTAIERLRGDAGIQFHVLRQRIYDAVDYAGADFVEIYGVALDEQPGSKLVLNADEVLNPESCPQCGVHTVFDHFQSGPLVIDEAQLDLPAFDGAPAPHGGWDFIEVESGLKLVSGRFAAVLADLDVAGYSLEPVMSESGGPSARAWLLRARHAILVPCAEHTRPIDGDFCPTCGAAHCDVEDEDFVRADVVGHDEIFARHRFRASILYASGRVYRALIDAGIQQVSPSRLFRVCHHASPSGV